MLECGQGRKAQHTLVTALVAVASQAQALEATARKRDTTDTLEKILMDLGIPEVDIYEAQASVMGVPFFQSQSSITDGIRSI